MIGGSRAVGVVVRFGVRCRCRCLCPSHPKLSWNSNLNSNSTPRSSLMSRGWSRIVEAVKTGKALEAVEAR